MVAHGSAFPVAKLALNNSVPPVLMASLRMGLVLLILIVNNYVDLNFQIFQWMLLYILTLKKY